MVFPLRNQDAGSSWLGALFGAIPIVMSFIHMRTGKIRTRSGNLIRRVENPIQFEFIVAIEFVGGAFLAAILWLQSR